MIGLLGGTFNPPHIGHMREAVLAKDRLGLSCVIFMPNSIPPHKALPADTPDALDRLEMAKIAAHSLPFAEVSDLEIKREGASYTIDTLKELSVKLPGQKIVLLCGSDMLVSMESWKNGSDILRNYTVAAFARGSEHDALMQEKAREFNEKYHADIMLFEDKPLAVQSTGLRGVLRLGFGKCLLPEGVYEYILSKGLYGVT